MIKLDSFGIGAAQFMALDLFENASRASGRTQFILGCLRPGDAIIFPDEETRRYHREYFRDGNKKIVLEMRDHHAGRIGLFVLNPMKDARFEMGTNPYGHTYLSHEFVLESYRIALQGAAKYLEGTENNLSASKPATPQQTNAYHAGLRMREMAYGRHPL